MAINQEEWLKKRDLKYKPFNPKNPDILAPTVKSQEPLTQDQWLSKRNLTNDINKNASDNKNTYFGEDGKIINTNGWKNNKAAAIGATAIDAGYHYAKGRTGVGAGEAIGDFVANTANESFLGGLFRKAGSAIGTGINYAITGAHNLFTDDEHDWDWDYANQMNYDDDEYKQKVREAIQEDMADKAFNGGYYYDLTGQTPKAGFLDAVQDYSLSGDVTDSVIQSVGDSMAQRDISNVIAGKGLLGDKIAKNNGQIPFKMGKLKIDMPVTSFFSGFTANANDTYAKGGGIGDALIRGTYGGAVEMFTEGFNGMYGLGGSSIDDLIDGTVKKIKNNAVRGAASLITNAAEEGFEEGLSYVLNQAGDAIYDSVSGKKFREKFSGEELGLNMLAGAAAGGLGGFGGALMIANMKPELQQNNPLYGSSQLRQLQEQYEQRLKENEEQLKAWNESPEVINGTAPRIDENSQDIQDVNKLLARFGINVAYTNDFARLAQQNSNGSINANNIAGIWSERRNPDGTISRFVKLNPEYTGEDTISQVLMHELTHDIGGSKKFQKIVNSIINNSELSQKFNELSNELAEIYSNLPEYQEAFKSNPEKYQEAFKLKIQEEAVANILSGLGGEETLKYIMSDIKPLQEALGLYTANFKNSLVNSKNEFISGLAQSLMKTDKKQASAEQILATVKQALQENYKSRGDNDLYSIGGIKGLENADLQNHPEYTNFVTKGIAAYNEAINMANQGIDNEKIREKTRWFQDKNGDWKYEFSDKDFKLKMDFDDLEVGKIYKLSQIISHPYLEALYPNIMDMDVLIVNNKDKAPAQYSKYSAGNKEYNIILLNKGAMSKNNLKKNLIHEIQHAIQDYENFSSINKDSYYYRKAYRRNGGKNETYYKSMFEAEAINTSERMLREQKGENLKDMEPPFAANKEAVHPKLNKYLENRTFKDKILDKLYDSLIDSLKDKKKTMRYNEKEQQEKYRNELKGETKNDVIEEIKKEYIVPVSNNIFAANNNRSDDRNNKTRKHENKTLFSQGEVEEKYNKHALVLMDTEGNFLPKGVRDNLANVDDYMFDNNRFKALYHGTGGKGPVSQFNTMDSRKGNVQNGSDILFGDNNVVYTTTNKIIGSSYANDVNDEPISKRLQSIDDVKEVLASINKKLNSKMYELNEENGKYEIKRMVSDDVVSNEFNSLTKNEKSFLKDMWLKKSYNKSFDNYVRTTELGPLYDRYYPIVKNIEAAARPGRQANEMFEEFKKMLKGEKKATTFQPKVVITYNSKDEMYRNLATDIQNENGALKGQFLYKLYAYPENVFRLTADSNLKGKGLAPKDAINWAYVYTIEPEDTQSKYFDDWWKKILKYRSITASDKGPNETAELSSDEFVSFVIDVINKERIDAGEKPYDAVAIEDVYDPYYSAMFKKEKGTNIVMINSENKIKFADNTDPHLNNGDLRYLINTGEDEAKDYFKSTVENPGSKMKDITKKEKAPAPKKEKAKVPTKESIQAQIENGNENIQQMANDIYSPFDIANSTPEDANVIPNLPNVKRKTGSGKSKFAEQVKKSNFLTQEQKDKLVQDAEINSYEKVNNRDTVNKAIERIDKGYAKEAYDWFNRDKFDAVDMAEGLMYLKLYSESGKYDEMEKVAAKIREMGTKYGQTIQAMSLLSRMTPEGMVYHAEKELNKAWEELKKTKSQEWLRKNSENFHLTNEDIDQIKELTEIASTQTGYDKEVSLALIQKIVTSHIPTTVSEELKSYFRIAMLLNPKTQVRNMAGNAIIAPVNAISDIFASVFDKAISKKTGYRTVTAMNNQDIKNYISEAKNAWKQAYNEAKLGINTRSDLDRYERGYSDKPFTEKTIVGKAFNKLSTALNLAMDGGDRMFANGEYRTALDRIMRLNGVTEPTQDMIDLAENIAAQRTWNDNNEYTKFVLNIRSGLNNAFGKFKIGNNQFGIGDVLIPFAKTPANLTKAIVDYSPMGFLKAAGMKNELFNKIADGTATLQDQRKFVDTLGKATAGSLLYVLGYALAKAGILSGEADDDKDVKDFIKNSLGISSYSIKIGDTSFTYDWAQPIAAPFAITSNIVNSKQNSDENYASGFRRALEGFLGSVDSAGAILLDQSFLQSISDVLNNQSGVVSGLVQEVTELPARAVPTFISQINDLVDDTKRQTFTSKNVLKSSIDYAKSKIPGVSKTLAPSVNTMGKEIKKYGGNNNWFNVFFNPANVNTKNMDENAEEIYKIYQSTGDKTIMPSVAPYSDTTTGHIYTPEERAKYQKISGSIISDTVDYLRNYRDDGTGYDYESLSDQEKADILSKINSFAKQVAKHEVLGTEISSSYKNAYEYYQHGDLGAYYLDPEGSNYALNNPEKYSVVTSTMTYKTYKKHSKAISDLRANTDKDKEETINYINNIPDSDFSGGYDDIPINVKRAMLLKSYYPSYHDYDSQIVSAVIAHCDMSSEKGQEMAIGELKKLGFKNPTIKGGRLYYD